MALLLEPLTPHPQPRLFALLCPEDIPPFLDTTALLHCPPCVRGGGRALAPCPLSCPWRLCLKEQQPSICRGGSACVTRFLFLPFTPWGDESVRNGAGRKAQRGPPWKSNPNRPVAHLAGCLPCRVYGLGSNPRIFLRGGQSYGTGPFLPPSVSV